MQQYSKKILVCITIFDVLIAVVSAIGMYVFGHVWSLFNTPVDLRWMLPFVFLGIAGAVWLTLVYNRKLKNPLWAIALFIAPLGLALYWWIGYMQGASAGLDGIVALGIPVFTYVGGIVLSVYMRLNGKVVEE